ncbi:hypothetical protein HYR99_14560 [Candidatus Poribacteria bacterium]|nr:hypothetical protein [Candidatus Poribacteria bacterium]
MILGYNIRIAFAIGKMHATIKYWQTSQQAAKIRLPRALSPFALTQKLGDVAVDDSSIPRPKV